MLNLCRSREASDTESQTAEGEAITGRGGKHQFTFRKKKKKIRRRESSVNPQTPRPHRQISAGDFFY